MTIIKHGVGEIIGVVSDGKETDDEKAKKALEAAQQAAKNIDEAGNKTDEAK